MNLYFTYFIILFATIINLYYFCKLLNDFYWNILVNKYERKSSVNEYLRSQYGPFLKDHEYFDSEPFYRRIIEESAPYLNANSNGLDVGCGLGRLAFEFEYLGIQSCVGIDSSKRFIKLCRKIQEGKAGLLFRPKAPGVTTFLTIDILNFLPAKKFDFIACINVFDRVVNPKGLIRRLLEILNSGGVVILTTPYDWEQSPALSQMHFEDMKMTFSESEWEIAKEERNIPYVIYADGKNTKYNCHLLILKKK